MDRGQVVFFVDVGHSKSLLSTRLPLSIYKGTIIGTGNTLIAVKTNMGTICFDRVTGFSQAKDYKLYVEIKLARRIIAERRKRTELVK